MFSDNLLLSSVIICAIFCLCPLFTLSNQNYFSTCNQDRLIHAEDTASAHLLISLSIVLIPAVDLFADFIAYHFIDEKPIKLRKSTILYRLTDIERLIFIIGVAMESVIFFLPKEISLNSLHLVNSSIDNASILLILSPIVICLGRCCMAFTPIKTFIIILCAVAGMTLRTISSITHENTMHCDMISVGSSVICLGAFLYILSLVFCMSKRVMHNFGTSSNRRLFNQRLVLMFQRPGENHQDNSRSNLFDDTELSTNCVPAILVLSSIFIMIPRALQTAPTVFQMSDADKYLKYITLCAEIVILVAELRVRKNETARGLVSYLLHLLYMASSKLSYSDISDFSFLCRLHYFNRSSRTCGTSHMNCEHL